LLQIGFLARTRRGRELTRPGATYLGLAYTPSVEANQGTLFQAEDADDELGSGTHRD
jgi:hypothetical protein